MKPAKEVNEYIVLVYRVALMMLLYSVSRIAFYLFNIGFFPNVTFSGFLTIMKGGLMFDISALLYINMLYLLLYLLPFRFKFKSAYQSMLKWLFLISNSLGLAANVFDFIYYRFTLKRTTWSIFDIFKNEDNMPGLWIRFLYDYWYAFLFWIVMVLLMYFLYDALKPKPMRIKSPWLYGLCSLLFLGIFAGLAIVGIRGGYRHSTRPINMSNSSSSSLVKSPLSPILDKATSRILSPVVLITTISLTRSGKASLSFFCTSSACHRASRLPRVPILISRGLLIFFLIKK
jgi:hypothetical protein